MSIGTTYRCSTSRSATTAPRPTRRRASASASGPPAATAQLPSSSAPCSPWKHVSPAAPPRTSAAWARTLTSTPSWPAPRSTSTSGASRFMLTSCSARDVQRTLTFLQATEVTPHPRAASPLSRAAVSTSRSRAASRSAPSKQTTCTPPSTTAHRTRRTSCRLAPGSSTSSAAARLRIESGRRRRHRW